MRLRSVHVEEHISNSERFLPSVLICDIQLYLLGYVLLQWDIGVYRKLLYIMDMMLYKIAYFKFT